MAELANRYFEADERAVAHRPGGLDNWLLTATVHFHPARDALLAEVDGTLVAYGRHEWVDTTDGLREYRMRPRSIRPGGARGDRDLAARTLEAHVAELAARNPTTGRRSTGSWAADRRADRSR